MSNISFYPPSSRNRHHIKSYIEAKRVDAQALASDWKNFGKDLTAAMRKINHKKSYAGHILTKKSTQRKRNLRQAGYISKADANSVSDLMPYAK